MDNDEDDFNSQRKTVIKGDQVTQEIGKRESKKKKVECTHCFNLNKEKLNFCTNCGSKLKEGVEVASFPNVGRIRGDNHSPLWIVVDNQHATSANQVTFGKTTISHISDVYSVLLGNQPSHFTGKNLYSLLPKIKVDFTGYIHDLVKFTVKMSGCFVFNETSSLISTDRGELYNIYTVSTFTQNKRYIIFINLFSLVQINNKIINSILFQKNKGGTLVHE